MYEFISDPGHGWLKVPLADLRESGYVPTEFSYYDSNHAFLEEDCDASLFLHKIGVRKPNLKYREVANFNRNLPNFPKKPSEITWAEMAKMHEDYKED